MFHIHRVDYIKDITLARGDTKFLFECWNNTRRKILYLQAAM